MKVVYIKLLKNTPFYIGEGSLQRSKDNRPRNKLFKDVKGEQHVCSLIISSHLDKVGSVLQEQGFIMWLGRRITDEGPLTNILPYGDLGHSGQLPPEVEKERRNKISVSVKENYHEQYVLSNHGQKVANGRRLRFIEMFGKDFLQRVHSWWLRSRDFPSPLSEANNRKRSELSNKVLSLLIQKEVPISITRRLQKGEDFGGRSEDVPMEEFQQQWDRVRKDLTSSPNQQND